ncbi:MAG: (2Fe-2S)-binding protein, partial [Nanoarchaeota archaeon]|nr:(2Fe-2S)-binding protein [Nanoarchaeota archaeon]
MQITLDKRQIKVEEGKTILDICKERGIEIPTLCIFEGLKPEARCRLCLVELNGKLVTSCSTYPHEGCEVVTDSPLIKKHRMINAELLMADHIATCNMDPNSHDLCKIIEKIGLTRIRFDPIHKYKQDLSESVIRDDNKCINCGKCIRACGEIMDVHAIDFINRGHNEKVSPYSEHKLHD